MTAPETLAPRSGPRTEHFDVLIVGAGISGVGAAYHLTTQRPGTSFVVLEAIGRARLQGEIDERKVCEAIVAAAQ